MLQTTASNALAYREALCSDARLARAAVRVEVQTAIKLLAVAICSQGPHARFVALRPDDYGKWMTLVWVGNEDGERVADDSTMDAGLLDTHGAEAHLYVDYFDAWGKPYLYDYRARHRRPTDCSADHDTYLDLQKILESS